MAGYLGMHQGVRLESYYVTGAWKQVADHLERSLVSFTRSDRAVLGWYIGISSGLDQESAMKARIDEKKALYGHHTDGVCL